MRSALFYEFSSFISSGALTTVGGGGSVLIRPTARRPSVRVAGLLSGRLAGRVADREEGRIAGRVTGHVETGAAWRAG